jgi:hypothetical protein
MYRLTTKITLGNYSFNFCNEVEIESSWQDLTDTATIIIPKQLTADNKPVVNGTEAVFKVGDMVQFELGYEFQNDTVFQGYISDIKPKIPLEIKCEDAMWLLKQNSFKKTFKAVTVKELVSYITRGLKAPVEAVFSFPDMQLGKFRINNATGAQVLEELRKTYGILSFFRESKLYVGFAYSHTDTNYRNIIPLQFTPNVIADDLIYKDKNNQKIKIKAISIHQDNKQEEYETGDGDGQLVPVFTYNKSHADLKKLADNMLSIYKVDGFQGKLTTFGKPFIRQGDAVELRDYKLPERNGTYLIKKVVRTFGQGGYRQELELDRRIN